MWCALAAAAAGGCKSQNKADQTDQELPPPASQPSAADMKPKSRNPGGIEETQLKIQQAPVAVTQGPTPLVYIFDFGASIRVVDLTTGQTLVTTTVSNRTLVRVDDRNGVTVGSDNVYPGKLAPGHQYAIYVDPTTPNTMRHGVGPPQR
jgi:hypothetical protein